MTSKAEGSYGNDNDDDDELDDDDDDNDDDDDEFGVLSAFWGSSQKAV